MKDIVEKLSNAKSLREVNDIVQNLDEEELEKLKEIDVNDRSDLYDLKQLIDSVTRTMGNGRV